MPTNQICVHGWCQIFDRRGLLNFLPLDTNIATEQDQTFSATYQVNTALLANHIHVYGPYVAPSIQSHWNPTVTQQTVSQAFVC